MTKTKFLLVLPFIAFFTSCSSQEKKEVKEKEALPGDSVQFQGSDHSSVIKELRAVNTPGEVANPVPSGPRKRYTNRKASFSVAVFDSLVPVPFDSIPWYELQEQQTAPENDQMAYFFFPGEEFSLAATHVRVEWLAKGYDQRNKEEELHQFIKTAFLGSPRNAQIIKEDVVYTQDKQPVKILELYIPSIKLDSATTTTKISAWAWADHGNSFIGFNLSSTEPAKYKKAIKWFRQMIASYKNEN